MQETQISEVEPQVFGNAEQPSAHRDLQAQNLANLQFTRGYRRLGISLFMVSISDIFISGFMAGIAFDHAYLDNGVSLYCLGLQVLSHWVTSIILALRMLGQWCQPAALTSNGAEDQLITKQQRTVLVREQAMSICMAIAMLLSAAALVFKAARKIRFWDKWYEDHEDIDDDVAFVTKWLAFYGVVVYSLQAFMRGMCACFMQRVVITNALVVSIVSIVFLLVLGVAAVEEAEWSWKAEPMAALVLSLVSIAEAIRIVYMHFDNMEDRMQYDPESC